MTLTSSMTTGLLVSGQKFEVRSSDTHVAIEEILHAFLPEELREGAPTGFAMVGHIGMSMLLLSMG